jgi:hypothetical protein
LSEKRANPGKLFFGKGLQSLGNQARRQRAQTVNVADSGFQPEPASAGQRGGIRADLSP